MDELADYPDAASTMLKQLPDADGDLLLHICKALAQHPHKKMIPVLLDRWEQAPAGSPGARYIPDVLAAIGDRSVVPDLVQPLKGLRFDFRLHIAYALGILGGPLAEQTLQDMAANDPLPAIRTFAAEQLQKVQAPASQQAAP